MKEETQQCITCSNSDFDLRNPSKMGLCRIHHTVIKQTQKACRDYTEGYANSLNSQSDKKRSVR